MDVMHLNLINLTQHRPQRLAATARSSALMLPLVMHGGARVSLLLTRRHAGLRQYAGHWCLPGGRLDAADASLLACAWRELAEETGLRREGARLLAELDDFYNGKGELVRPFVCSIEEAELTTRLRLQSSEAVEFTLLPLERLADIGLDSQQLYPSARHPAYLLELDGQGHVWGLTASILLHLRNVLTDARAPLCRGEIFQRTEALHEH